MTILTIAALALASGQPGALASGQSSTSSDAGGDRRVCRTVDADTGSRLGGRRICKTQREWEAQRAQEQSALDSVQRSRGN